MAASSAPAATTRFPVQSHVPSPRLKGCITSVSCSFTSLAARNRAQRLITARNSSSEISAETTETKEAEEEASEAPVELPKGPPSLISALNVEKAIRGIAITDVDHYGRLGLGRGCSYDQVRLAYKNKVDELLNRGLEEGELNNNLELLKESYAILSSADERRFYDWSLARNDNPDRYTWPFEVDITQTPSPDSPPPQEPEDVWPTTLVGYFTLAWLILSFTLLIVFNR